VRARTLGTSHVTLRKQTASCARIHADRDAERRTRERILPQQRVCGAVADLSLFSFSLHLHLALSLSLSLSLSRAYTISYFHMSCYLTRTFAVSRRQQSVRCSRLLRRLGGTVTLVLLVPGDVCDTQSDARARVRRRIEHVYRYRHRQHLLSGLEARWRSARPQRPHLLCAWQCRQHWRTQPFHIIVYHDRHRQHHLFGLAVPLYSIIE
jgi:hypothetical protein